MSKAKGFTLTEVIIAMAVMGILAAVLIPAITKVTPDSDSILFKKAYSTLEKTVSELINDDMSYPADLPTQASSDNPKRNVQPGFAYTTTTTDMGVPAGNDKFCYLFSQKMNTAGTPNCTLVNPANLTTPAFITNDGVAWYFLGALNTFTLIDDMAQAKQIFVDVNGAKAPNCGNAASPCVGTTQPDRFQMGVRYDGKIEVVQQTGQQRTGRDILTDPTDNRK